jgi:chromosome segregation ATPase
MIDKQQLQAMGEEMQQRLQECANGAAKMQEQRDQLAAQLKNATAQCGVLAGLLREARVSVDYHQAERDSIALYHLLSRIDAALAGKLPELALAMPEGWQLVPVEPTDFMLDMAHQVAAATGGFPEVWAEMLSAAPNPQWGE